MDLRKITKKEIPKEYQNLPQVFVSAIQKDIGQKNADIKNTAQKNIGQKDTIAKLETAIYQLIVSPEFSQKSLMLWQRIKEDKTRPKDQQQSESEEQNFLAFKNLYQSRLSQYQKADFTISIKPEQVADKIITIYKGLIEL